MNGTSSGLVSGTSGTQETLEQYDLEKTVAENEKAAKESYLRDTLPQSSPMAIPRRASYRVEHKTGYEQVKYTWTSGDYKYISRWHSRTPNSPSNQSESWVVEKIRPGVGSGKNARSKEHYILTGKTSSGGYKWTDKSKWDAAIRANKNGTATKKQKEMLNNGHW